MDGVSSSSSSSLSHCFYRSAVLKTFQIPNNHTSQQKFDRVYGAIHKILLHRFHADQVFFQTDNDDNEFECKDVFLLECATNNSIVDSESTSSSGSHYRIDATLFKLVNKYKQPISEFIMLKHGDIIRRVILDEHEPKKSLYVQIEYGTSSSGSEDEDEPSSSGSESSIII